MCFGDTKPTETKTTNNTGSSSGMTSGSTSGTNATSGATSGTTSLPAWLTAASKGNTDYLTNLRNAGYQEYQAPRVADASADENSAYSMIRNLAGSQNPYTSDIEALFKQFANTPASSVGTTRAIDNVPGAPGTAGGSTQDYMNPFIDAVLAPQLRELDRNQTRSQNSLDANRTMGGAFGDARSGFEAAENTRNFSNAKIDTTGKANSDAYNQAMSLKSNDIARLLDVAKSNAALKETGLQRSLTGGQALTGLDQSNTGRTADLAGLLQTSGSAQRGIEQSKLDAAYQEFSKATGYPLEISKMIIQALSGSPAGKEATTSGTTSGTGTTSGNTSGTTLGTTSSAGTAVTERPDNSGWGLLGSLGGSALGSIGGPVGSAVGSKVGSWLTS